MIYDQLCKSPLSKSPTAFATVGFALMVGATYALCSIFSARAAYIHVGAMVGTMMAANVFFVIIPNQRTMVDAMIRGEEPDTSLGDAGALRSFHNNYFTLPVLFIMISNHFPMTYGHTSIGLFWLPSLWRWCTLLILTQGAAQGLDLPVAAVAMMALPVSPQQHAP